MLGSRSSSKKGCTIASTADSRCVGVYSSNLEIKSMALGSAFRKTYKCDIVSKDTHVAVAVYKTATRDDNAIYLIERMWLDLWKLMLHVIWIHCSDLLSSRCAEHFDDFNQLIDARLAREKWLSKHKLCHDASGRPYVLLTVSKNL